MEDLRTDPRTIWLNVQAFLEVPDDRRTVFAAENTRAVPRFVGISRVLRILQRIKHRVLPGFSIGFGAGLGRALERAPTAEETKVSAELVAELVQRFKGEIDILERLTGRDLSLWRRDAA